MFQNFFSKAGAVEPYKAYSAEHFILICICGILIIFALWKYRKADRKTVLSITRWCAIALWILEIIKIVFNLLIGNANNPNTYIPLYFCSIPLYGLIMCGWGKGLLKRNGEVFMIVGGMVGGIGYILSPNTSAGLYQAFHFITVQSFILHGIMVFLSLLYIITGYYRLVKDDVKFYGATVLIMCIVAYIVNCFLGSNLMFVSRNFPGTPIEILYNVSPKAFPFLITFIQVLPPFVVVYGLIAGMQKLFSVIGMNREAGKKEKQKKEKVY
ncbi:MAG: hypothetical protein E7403_00375 [Ruminococcaceae bacterium]|nr:hypothetical protein [Oscillospiraceae bacterium]